jgi:hypothetical protein
VIQVVVAPGETNLGCARVDECFLAARCSMGTLARRRARLYEEWPMALLLSASAMATERTLELPQTPSEALVACAHAFAAGRFKQIATDEAAMTVTGRKRPLGQWTRGTVVASVEPGASGEGSIVTIRSDTRAQSLVGLASPPSERLVARFVSRLVKQ